MKFVYPPVGQSIQTRVVFAAVSEVKYVEVLPELQSNTSTIST